MVKKLIDVCFHFWNLEIILSELFLLFKIKRLLHMQKIYIGVLLMLVILFQSCVITIPPLVWYGERKVKVVSGTDDVSIVCENGATQKDGYFSVYPHGAYLFYIEKDGFESQSVLVQAGRFEKSKKNEIITPKLLKYPSTREVGVHIGNIEFSVNAPDSVYYLKPGAYLDDNKIILHEGKEQKITELRISNENVSEKLLGMLSQIGLADPKMSVVKDQNKSFKLEIILRQLQVEEGPMLVGMSAEDYYLKNGVPSIRYNGVFDFVLKDRYGTAVCSKSIESSSIVLVNHNNDVPLLNAVQRGLTRFFADPDILLSAQNHKVYSNKVYDMSHMNIAKPAKSATNIQQFLKCTVTVKNETGYGSGCIISKDGYIVTNYHVVDGDSLVSVILNSGEILKAEVVRADAEYDLALLKIDYISEFGFDIKKTQNINLTETVFVVGTPANESLGQTISMGIISAKRNLFGRDYFQTDARVNGGNSGGALLNEKGELLGIVSSKIVGIGVEGVGFAIPAKYIFERLMVSLN
jgi:S1-C subfamily serine protease